MLSTSVPSANTTGRSTAKRAPYPRRLLLTSMSQALIAISLALSILTFVISLIEFLPMRSGDLARQESLQYNTFVCLIVPFVLAYCSQSKVISALTQQWILRRICTLQECLSPAGLSSKLGDAFRHSAAVAGLSCLTGPMNFTEDPIHGTHKKHSSGVALSEDSAFMNSSKLVTTSLTIHAEGPRSKHAHVMPEQLFASLILQD
jgi:hypothetical protein